MFWKLVWPVATSVVALAVFAGLAVGNNGRENDKTFQYSIGLWGDLPYSDVQATTGVPNLIADMNASKLVFTVHDGDLKAGNGTSGSATPTICADPLYAQGLSYLNMLQGAAMFTPGDNDWTDCDRAKNGSFNSLERLDYERQLFFSGHYATMSAGTKPMQEEVQGTQPRELECKGVGTLDNAVPPAVTNYKDVPCVENRRWTYGGITYATFDVQGSCNNLCDTNPDSVEEVARNAADIQWLDQTFAEAKTHGSAGVMLISQADPGFDGSDATRAPLRDPVTLAETDGQPDGFQSWLQEVRKDTIEFGKPVVYVHGDSHYFRVDKPLADADTNTGTPPTGKRIENFTRLETFGDNQQSGTNDVQWVKVLIDPSSRDVFAFQPQIVPDNVPGYLAG